MAVSEVVRKAREKVSKQQQTFVLRERAKGKSYADIAKAMGVTGPRVHQIERAAGGKKPLEEKA